MQKPILIGGLGLSLVLALLTRWEASIFDVGEWLFWGAIALGGLTLWKQKPSSLVITDTKTPLAKKEVEQAIAKAEQWLETLQLDAPNQDYSPLSKTLDSLKTQFDRTALTGVITGGRGTGKTSLLRQLAEATYIDSWTETPPLFTDLASYDQAAQEQVFAADLVLFLINGDLMASQWETLKHWLQARQRIMLVFNKQDQYQPEQRQLILEQLRQHVHPAIAPSDVMAITAAPQGIKVKQIQEDGTVTEFFEQPEPEITVLENHLQTLCTDKASQQQLVWSTLWRNAQLVQHQAKQQLNNRRRERALPILEKYQWLAAGATFANPVVALDLLATAAVTGQMIMDVGEIYQQKVSLNQAQAIATAIGKQMVQLGLVELSTQAIAGILKTNLITYVAGGAVQGVSAAYLTHIAGLSLIQYFQEQDPHSPVEGLNIEKLGQILKTMFEQNQRGQFLQTFTQNILTRRSPQAIG
jgi:GTPase SAR1 family protein